MRKFSNFYIFGFASILVIIVAALLSFVSEELKPLTGKKCGSGNQTGYPPVGKYDRRR